MSIAVKDLLYDAGGNLSRSANFRMELLIPSAVGSSKKISQYDVLCKNIDIPEIHHKTNDITFKGSTFTVRGRTDYSRVISMSLLLDERQDITRDISVWIQGIDLNSISQNNDVEILRKNKNREDLLGNIKITSKDWNEKDTVTYEFTKVFPVKFGPINYDSTSVSNIIEVSIEFGFFEMKRYGSLGLGETLLDSVINSANRNIVNPIKKKLGSIEDKILEKLKINNNYPEEEVIKEFKSLLKSDRG